MVFGCALYELVEKVWSKDATNLSTRKVKCERLSIVSTLSLNFTYNHTYHNIVVNSIIVPQILRRPGRLQSFMEPLGARLSYYLSDSLLLSSSAPDPWHG
jgi:hypothetical protein